MGCADDTTIAHRRIMRRIISAQRIALVENNQVMVAVLNLAMSIPVRRTPPPPPDYTI